MKLQTKKISSYSVYYYEEKYKEYAEKILFHEYKELKRIKDTPRNLVVLIEIEGCKYILKEPRNEYRILQRKWMSLMKKGEALSTLIHISYLRNTLNLKEYVEPYLVINRRKRGMIDYSAILYEYSSGEDCVEYLDEVVEKMERVHSLGFYHGDCNPSNFLIERNSQLIKVRILDTQGKKMGFTKYRAHYDMLTMKLDSYPEMPYPYSKDFSYYLALFVKKMKKWKWIKYLKNRRKKWRDNRA